jgi:hypothetical protein
MDTSEDARMCEAAGRRSGVGGAKAKAEATTRLDASILSMLRADDGDRAISRNKTPSLRRLSRRRNRATPMLLLQVLHATLALSIAPGRIAPLPTRRGGSTMQFGNPFENFKNPFKDESDGATTVALTLSFRVEDRGPRSILGQLESLAAAADTSTSQGISDLCSDAALLLLRRQNEWISCSGKARHNGNDDSALADFDRQAIREAAKFDDRDTGATVDAALKAAGVARGAKAQPTVAVVCALACVMGDREEEIGKSFAGDARAMRAALEELAAAGSADEEVFAFELFWVPGADDDVLQMDEVVLEWPELMTC